MEAQLTKENIQLIRDFLQKNGVAHTDILHELTDHVASACENLMQQNNQSFLEAFVPYMRMNGAILINKAYPIFDFSILKAFVLFCKNVSFFGCLAILIQIFFMYLKDLDFDTFAFYMPFLIVTTILSLVQGIYCKWFLKIKLFKIERLQILFFLFAYIF